MAFQWFHNAKEIMKNRLGWLIMAFMVAVGLTAGGFYLWHARQLNASSGADIDKWKISMSACMDFHCVIRQVGTFNRVMTDTQKM